ncbi:hypothetical protein N0U24_05170 [Peribacillus frigoritolerans]|uniref:hypothetical protein n=1 Tax=Peribacillus frigoritolerans TaxID=450367 RepID=UPI0021AAFA4A|nr:hypothetical protein [Peribacillus frigoritolerans]MCT4476550.1 hypothetical protein [Peribacillus frigoritolerans]
MTHVQKAVLHEKTTIIGELPVEALNVARAGIGPLPARKDALAGNGDLHAAHKGALAGGGPLAADNGAPTETGVRPTTAVGFAAITFAINGKGASSFMVPF